MEKINISKTESIPSQDDSRRFESLKEELLDYQFQYLDKIDNGELNLPVGNLVDNKKLDFFGMLEEYSLLPSKLRVEFYKRYPGADDLSEKDLEYKRKFFVKNCLKQIIDLRNQDKIHWKEGVKKIIFDNLNNIGPEINEVKNDKKEKCGLIHFNFESASKLSKFGILKEDDCVSIHFEDFYKQKNRNDLLTLFSIRDSFSNLAIEIVDKYPEVKAVVARSWLIDSVGERMGFTIYRKYQKIMGNPGFWGQFINEKGEINKERMQKFLETGVPEFFPTEGFIKTEDFLKKYLPKERRGAVKIKELSGESKKFLEEKDKFLEDFDKVFQDDSFEESRKLLEDSVLSPFFKTKEGEELLNFMREMKEKKLGSMDDLKNERAIEVRNALYNYIKEKRQYIDKEILID